MHTFTRVAYVLTLTVAGTGHLQSQAKRPLPPMARATVVELLNRSPILEPSMSVLREAQFVRDAQESLAGTDWESMAETALEATTALEAALAGQLVTATVRSVPPGVVVNYRRLVDANAPAYTVTSDDSLRLEPATYLFWATGPRGGPPQIQRVACATDCPVMFRFEPEK